MPKLVHDQRVFLFALVAGTPAVIACLILLWTGANQPQPRVQWTVTLLILGFWLGFCFSLRERVSSPLRTIANLLEAMREGDYSIRARGDGKDDAMSEVMNQVNAMAATLRVQRLGALEATTLLRKVMEEIEVAIFAFDGEQQLRLVNPAGEKLLGETAERLLGRDAEALGLGEFLAGDGQQMLQRVFSDPTRRWGVSRTTFREGGLPHQLLVITDITRPLREEELLAWQRLVRVLGHELNNSLAPIKSIAGSLETLLDRNPRAEDWEDDMRRGLAVIASRSEALSRFMSSYARLARLPAPTLAPVRVSQVVGRVVGLETRLRLGLVPGPELTMLADSDQMEQLLINLIRNAVDASIETGGGVDIGWNRSGTNLVIWVRDEGHGLSNTNNLFVPFFTTKPGGSGIGLVLSRKIAEAHGGSLALTNREDRPGCEARLTIPV
jgi:PAS domain S-box-containing protein